MADHSDRIKALSSKSRVSVLLAIAAGDSTVAQIVARTTLRQQAVEQALFALEEAGLVDPDSPTVSEAGRRAVAMILDKDLAPPRGGSTPAVHMGERRGFLPASGRDERRRDARARRCFGDGQGRPINRGR